MATETQVVKIIVADIKAHPDKYTGWASRYLRHRIYSELSKGELRGQWVPSGWQTKHDLVSKLEHKIHKKVGQPFRRKDRGPNRRRAAGKNEVTRR